MHDHRVKLERAQHLLDELQEQAEAHTKRCETLIQHRPSRDRRTHVYVATEVPQAHQVAALAGDVAHNARTALDHLAWAIASKHGVASSRLSFPVLAGRPPTLDKLMPGAPREVLEALDAEQPYQLKKGSISPLMIIHELNRIDKHRILLPAVFTIDNASWGVPDDNPVLIRDVPRDPLLRGATVATLVYERPIDDPGVSMEVDVHLHPRIESQTRVPAGYLTRGNLHGWALGTGVHRVGRVVERLEALL